MNEVAKDEKKREGGGDAGSGSDSSFDLSSDSEDSDKLAAEDADAM
jgi:hypothetical protein